MALNVDATEIISHGREEESLVVLEEQLAKRSPENLEEKKDLLKALWGFDLGRFLLKNKGLDGYWTAYLILHGPKTQDLSPLESWMIHEAPVVKATRERYGIFQKKLKAHVKDGMTVASLPCGLMDDLLSLNKKIHGVGIDLDQNSLDLAAKNAEGKGLLSLSFERRDGWQMAIENRFDVLTSNGLNIYEPDPERVVLLYKEFYKSLKPGGILITSFLTPPPALSKESPWKNYRAEDAAKQKMLFSDVIGAAWTSFRTEAETRSQLEASGFEVLEVCYDHQGMFPTVVAKKSL